MENEASRTKASANGQIVIGLLVVAFGVLFLLDNLNIIYLRHVIFFWPLAFIASGLVALCSDGPRSGRVTGIVLIAIGLALVLNRLGYEFISWRTFWPLVMIALGGLILYRTLGGGRVVHVHTGPYTKDDAKADNVIDITAILGGFERRVSTPDFRGGEITAIMGGCGLDLRDCGLGPEAVINVFAIWGGITIKVPPDWTVVLQGTPVMGGFTEKTARPPDNRKRLLVTGYAIMGGVEVRN
ncbi:cell wall-active antibiotics response protein [Massilia norwichensis]|uniref:Cell wall-active antibiotics response protein n=1 Tax=Massilia norwichensis TaxID=1442366 RepID=A0ABT2A7P0_9BURK|nr:cell wall-active antibiotics response protein [Massilia norwichensis]MCS0590226.1 cell wall-active antibiotics response protein [Massilia norwichensis]